MARKITFTKEELLALQATVAWLDYQLDGLDPKDKENKERFKARKGLSTLLTKMTEAGKALPNNGMTAAQFLAIFETWEHGTLPPTEARTNAWYGRLTKAIQGSGLTEKTLPGLLSYVGGWAKYKMAPESLLGNAGKWLAQAEANTGASMDFQPPAGLFDED